MPMSNEFNPFVALEEAARNVRNYLVEQNQILEAKQEEMAEKERRLKQYEDSDTARDLEKEIEDLKRQVTELKGK